MTDEGGKLRISEDIRPLAQRIARIHEAHVPPGIRADGFSLSVSAIQWGSEEYVPRLEGEESG